MIAFTLDPVPTLTFNDETIYGIGILQRLHQLSAHNPTADKLFHEVASVFHRITVPRIGFRLEDKSAIMPTKRIIDVGYDLTIVKIVQSTTPLNTMPLLTTMYETYVSLVIPLGYYAELVPRSSICKTGYMLANNVGIIDPGYTGTIKVPLIKVDPNAPDLELPLRIGQLILKQNVISEAFDASGDEVIQTERGRGGIGSTG